MSEGPISDVTVPVITILIEALTLQNNAYIFFLPMLSNPFR